MWEKEASVFMTPYFFCIYGTMAFVTYWRTRRTVGLEPITETVVFCFCYQKEPTIYKWSFTYRKDTITDTFFFILREFCSTNLILQKISSKLAGQPVSANMRLMPSSEISWHQSTCDLKGDISIIKCSLEHKNHCSSTGQGHQ